MNIADKAGVFREVARVLKPGARFTIYDIMRTSDGTPAFPVPWAQLPRPASSPAPTTIVRRFRPRASASIISATGGYSPSSSCSE